MLRKIATLLVIVLSVGATRLLACEWVCAESTAAQHAVPCHENAETNTAIAAGASHQCDDGDAAPVQTTPKITILKQSMALLGTVLPRVTPDMTTPASGFALSLDAPSVLHAPLNAILRI